MRDTAFGRSGLAIGDALSPPSPSSLPSRSDLDRGVWRSVYLGFGKRCLDLALVLVSLPVVLAIVALCAALVARDGHNPFFTQERVGRGGRVFRLWKLRTMVVDAEAQLEAHLARDQAARREWTEMQKLRRDPRITRIGRVLRRTSLDELPQLWNVLRGDMSLTGPRPMLPSQVALYPGRHYFDLLPGITGPWQISARNGSAFADRALYDDIYWETVSLKADIALLFGTPRSLVRATGL